MREPMPPSRAILKTAIQMAMKAGNEYEIERLKGLYHQLGKRFGQHRGNAVKEKFTLQQKRIRLAKNSGTIRNKTQTTTNNE